MIKPDSSEHRVQLLREYLLGTLPPVEAKRVESELAGSEAWREELERQRAALELLDWLPSVEPPGGLAERTITAVSDATERPPDQRPAFLKFMLRYGAVAVALIIVAAAVLPVLSRAREAARRSSSQNNLKQLGLVFKMYANENPGQAYPPLAPYPGVWMFDIQKVYPEYLGDLSVLVDPSHPDAKALVKRLNELAAHKPIDWEAITRIAAKSYVYAGWVVTSDEEAHALGEGVRRLAEADYEKDLQTPSGTLHRPREGIERFLMTDINNPAASVNAQSSIPIMFEVARPARWRRPSPGANVLYMDGHVSFVPEGQRFPVTPRARQVFESGATQ